MTDSPPDGKIPLVGCPVRVLSGPRGGERATVVRVLGANERMRADPDTFAVVVRHAKARLGHQWHACWYEAEAMLEDGSIEYGDDARFEVLDRLQTRGARFRPGPI
jgi:hypothetical protein